MTRKSANEAAETMNSSGRSSAGGETGINGYFYKGGQFLPSTDAPPGKWRMKIKGKNKLVAKSNELIAPGVFATQPTPYARGILTLIKHLISYADDGSMIVDPNLNPRALEHFGRGIRPGVKGVLSTETYDVEELVDLYNRGLRWIDVKPEDQGDSVDD
jgi:hypothetical protein